MNHPTVTTPYIVHRARTREEAVTWLATHGRGATFKIVHKVRDWLPDGHEWQVLSSLGHD